MTAIRVTVVVIFIAVMIAWKYVMQAIVENGGIIAGLMVIGGIFYLSYRMEARERVAFGEPARTWAETRGEVRDYFRESTPYILIGLLIFAFAVRYMFIPWENALLHRG